ncbi:MAG: nucleotide exchange factor GrpE [Chitinophagales bacterium]|nr:nucleotide exchange factor GrpE [Chitinophagales bacterium]MCO5280563.1 nucleotide exchange factor GrpE [Chitinophagales bacterium]OJV28363.1 MAG: nucleotide exchange factor GrpE [Bacteroidetes bacterium 37-13]HRN93400.1 nucleotide exchange factor GrpE [Chitinophagales bacterium]HRP38644.1 nucleotide exchange factor GrpE [Chitinophagales bacterium]
MMQEQENNEDLKVTQMEENTENTTISQAEENNAEVILLKQQVEELKDKYIRLFADFDNAKKRHAREQLELVQTASKDVIQSLLPVIDDFERAMKTLDTATEVNAVKEGMQLILQKFSSALSSKGLQPMEALHKEFNVEEHDAITEIPAPNTELVGKVVDEIQKGYFLNGKIIRHAKVVVGK